MNSTPDGSPRQPAPARPLSPLSRYSDSPAPGDTAAPCPGPGHSCPLQSRPGPTRAPSGSNASAGSGIARDQWFAQLSEWLPAPYVRARVLELESLRAQDGCNPREAAAYCRAFLLAPRTL